MAPNEPCQTPFGTMPQKTNVSQLKVEPGVARERGEVPKASAPAHPCSLDFRHLAEACQKNVQPRLATPGRPIKRAAELPGPTRAFELLASDHRHRDSHGPKIPPTSP